MRRFYEHAERDAMIQLIAVIVCFVGAIIWAIIITVLDARRNR
jgi:hypothetical protein